MKIGPLGLGGGIAVNGSAAIMKLPGLIRSLSAWVEAYSGHPGEVRYLHESGAQLRIAADYVVVSRGLDRLSRQAASRIEDCLTQFGFKLRAGIYESPEATYAAPAEYKH